MDIFSVIIFFIYIIAVLMILIYISPVLSILVLMFIPIASVYFLPEQTIRFFSIRQFSFAEVPVQNIHILLLIWSALIGIVAYSEIVSWYLLRDEKPKPTIEKPKELGKPTAVPLKSGETQKSLRNKAEDFLLKLGKVMSGKKG